MAKQSWAISAHLFSGCEKSDCKIQMKLEVKSSPHKHRDLLLRSWICSRSPVRHIIKRSKPVVLWMFVHLSGLACRTLNWKLDHLHHILSHSLNISWTYPLLTVPTANLRGHMGHHANLGADLPHPVLPPSVHSSQCLGPLSKLQLCLALPCRILHWCYRSFIAPLTTPLALTPLPLHCVLWFSATAAQDYL